MPKVSVERRDSWLLCCENASRILPTNKWLIPGPSLAWGTRGMKSFPRWVQIF